MLKIPLKKVAVIIGTRPEAIKMAPVIHALKAEENIQTTVISTGQHKELLDHVTKLFDIEVDHSLDIMRSNQTLAGITSKVVSMLDDLFQKERYDLILVHGDTTTAMGGALAGFYNKIKVGHVEAGLRTNDIYAPFPEEVNRKIISSIAYKNYAPTINSQENLLSENIDKSKIKITGNTVIDALFYVLERVESGGISIGEDILSLVENNEKKYLLVTGHRRENFGEGFISICSALRQLALNNSELEIIYPVHLNPNVKKVVHKHLSDLENVHLIPPLDYSSFIFLMSKSFIILTDSGGVQEEAPSLGIPVLVMREKTERPEAVTSGTVKIVGTNTDLIIKEVQNLLSNKRYYAAMSEKLNPYGDGKASKRIIEDILKFDF
ncbi:non-hydrolyzing UDP-N-acetylglucosamine 2-epimerase [Mangrovivirga cuniculi]|uniref:UDP-N-acetylglucosamine 2-epimerase (non-hydrolyzing) n=1 Tax=Mangrovivirga cuniculi TaxID=2715131 RepID=A0A4D7JV99_9BACT|nr:UDP-N-acetylglucosamine 2-epimerase (non-hydrolyzing) [Mangrovivirga cuniculi]QCK16492.1 UDP-N-acetylglucosamine 2-epimerase (non-hydrolyzing) [Mangrovivirga cuniculi]